LSVIASNFFTNSDEVLDVTKFVAFMAILAGIVHVIGAINLHAPTSSPNQNRVESTDRRSRSRSDDREDAITADERTSLLRTSPQHVPQQQRVSDLLKDPYFLLLGFLVLVTLGSVSNGLPISTAQLTTAAVRDGDI
jgi:hypothetical protein